MEKRKQEEPEKNESVVRLEELGIEQPIEYAFSVQEEKDGNGEKIDAEVFWLKFPAVKEYPESLPVEGKMYFPKKIQNGEAVIFVPGYPSGKAGRWERNYVNSLVNEGYIVADLRHNSTPLASQSPVEVFNCEQRIQESRGETHLGQKEGGFVLSDLIGEPLSVIKAVEPLVSRIKLVGHSFGAASLWYSVGQLAKRDPAVADKITHMISLAGYLSEGKVSEAGIWQGMKTDLDRLVQMELEDEQESGVLGSDDLGRIKESILKIAEASKDLKLPEAATQILVYSPDDPFISSPVIKVAREDGREVVSEYNYPGVNKKTLVVEDRTQDRKFHSLPGLLPKTLSRFLNMKGGKTPHFVVVKAKLPKEERKV
ncbi:MAG: hypothetical protein WC845_04075 [Candidatus Staskawiczbacteria bacterium]|jgi:hypothetical protein